MNKKLIALAVAAAIAPVAAMADSGNVTVYGIVDGSIDMVNPNYDSAKNNSTGAGNSSQRVNRIQNNSSRIGFKGTEDMGNGLSAVWQLETGFNVDGTTASDLNSRNTFIGLSSKTAGTAILGKHDTPYKLATRGLDLFGDGIADNRSIMGGGGAAKYTLSTTVPLTVTSTAITATASAGANFDGRQNNVIAYISPTVSGFHGAAAYVAGAEDALIDGQKKGSAWSLAGIYDNGPLFASIAYEKHNLGDAGTGTLGSPTAVAGLGPAISFANQEEHAWKLGVGYKMDAFRVVAAYEKTDDDFGLFGHHAYYLGGSYTMASNVVKLAYTQAGDMDAGSDTGAKQWTIGVDHNMSKRTKIYALYTKLSNDANATYSLTGGNNALPIANAIATTNGTTETFSGNSIGSSPSALSVGIRHSF